MADAFSITIEGLDELAAKLSVDRFQNAVRTGLIAGGNHAKNAIAEYPNSPGGRPQPFKTLKQRRYFFWALRNGIIEVPYRRTGTLGRNWTTRALSWSKVRVGNATVYGQVVQAKDEQSEYHRLTGWKTVEDVVDEEERAVLREVEDGINAYLRTL